MLIGICGGIGSGKSVVSRILRLRGEEVYDCDLEARRLMDSDAAILRSLHERYGPGVCGPRGPICRPALSEVVFSDAAELEWLNALVHSAVRAAVGQWAARLERAGRNRCFVESAILAGSGLAAMCGEVWLVTAPEDVRERRAALRDGLDPGQIRRRMESQRQETAALMASGVRVLRIDNDGSRPLLPQTEQILPDNIAPHSVTDF